MDFAEESIVLKKSLECHVLISSTVRSEGASLARPESRAAETSFAIFVFVVPVMMVMPLAVILMMVERFCSDTPSYPAGLAGARRNYFPTG